MKLVFAILISVFMYADVVNNKNISVLEALNIEDSFITYPDLQKIYKNYYHKKKEYFLNVLENGYNYLPLIKESILKSDVPKELVSVAMAESYLTASAKSHKRALGLWQFMPVTAKKYGLRIDDYVDERKDPVKSTRAAVEYLSYLHRFFGKWYLAVLAYNAGEARVVEAVVRAKVDKLCASLGKKCKRNPEIKNYRKIIKNYQKRGRLAYGSLYRLYQKLQNIPVSLRELLTFQKGLKRQYLPKETRNYIMKILSLSFLFNSDDFIKYTNSYLLNSGIVSDIKRVNVPAGTSLYYVSKILDVPYEKIREYNQHLKNSFTPPYKYYIYIPYNKMAEFKMKFHPKRYFAVYKIKKGDTLYKIAKKFSVKIKVLKDFNKLGRYLRVGQKIVVPLNSVYISYKVKKGDTLGLIAKKFGVNYKKIMKINDLKNTLIHVGEVLKIPQGLR